MSNTSLTILQQRAPAAADVEAWLIESDYPLDRTAIHAALRGLEGRISASRMIALNAAAEIDRVPFAVVAADPQIQMPQRVVCEIRCRNAFQNKTIQTIKPTLCPKLHLTTLRRMRINVIKMFEILWILEITEN